MRPKSRKVSLRDVDETQKSKRLSWSNMVLVQAPLVLIQAPLVFIETPLVLIETPFVLIQTPLVSVVLDLEETNIIDKSCPNWSRQISIGLVKPQ